MNRKVYEESLDTSLVPLVNDVLFLIVTSCFFCGPTARGKQLLGAGGT
jgi:hypothetical protein